jgi:hypothetical protein
VEWTWGSYGGITAVEWERGLVTGDTRVGSKGVNGVEWAKRWVGSRWEIWEGAINKFIDGAGNRMATTLQLRCFP